MEQIKEYPLEFVNSFLMCFDLLNRCNIRFFDENISFFKKYWRFFYIIPFVLIHYLTITAYMSRIFTRQVMVSELAFMVPVYLIQVQAFLKALIIVPKKRNISKLISQLGRMWRMDNLTQKQINKKNNLLKSLNFSHMVFYWGTIIASWQNITAPLLLTLFQKFILQQDYEWQLPFGCIYPFDPVKNWFIYIFMYIFQTYTMFRTVYFYIGAEFVVITLCAHLTTEFSLLREDLREVVPVMNIHLNDRTRTDQYHGHITIQQFICRHQKLIELSSELNGIFSKMVFINLLFSTFIMCCFVFGGAVTQDIIEKANNYIALLALMYPIYVFCYYAEQLKEESAGIADSAYENLWYKGGIPYQKTLTFIIMRAQRPCCLTSLEYTPITLNSFIKIVSTTWSYFSLAMSVYSKD